MTLLTLEQILTDCENVKNNTRNYSFVAGAFFSVLHFTGCRVEELTDLSRWSKPLPNLIELQTAKRGGIRQLNPEEIDREFQYLFLTQPHRGSYMSNSNMRRIHNVFTAYPNAMVKNKQISVHIFRHAKIKFLHSNYVPVATIANMFGYSDVETAQYYIDSEIYLP